MSKSLLIMGTLSLLIALPNTAQANMPSHGTKTEASGTLNANQLNRFSTAQPYARINAALTIVNFNATAPYNEEYLEVSAPNSQPMAINIATDCTRVQQRFLDCFFNYPLSTADMATGNSTVLIRYFAKKPGFEAYKSQRQLISGTARSIGGSGASGTGAACPPENAPMMPTTTSLDGSFTFSFPAGPTCSGEFFIDPPVSSGYDYVVVGTRFSEVTMPSLATINDTDGYTLHYSGATGLPETTQLQAGANFQFPVPIHAFHLRDIDPVLALDPNDPNAFPTGIVLLSATNAVSVRQSPVTVNSGSSGGNTAPIAIVDSVVDGTTFSGFLLDGAQSMDPDGDPLTYAWTQISGPVIPIPYPTFAQNRMYTGSPNGPGNIGVFELIVSDGFLSSRPAQVYVTLR